MALTKTTINRIIFIVLLVLLAGAVVYFVQFNRQMQQLRNSLNQTEQERMRLQTTLDQSRSSIEGQRMQVEGLAQEKKTLLSEKQVLQQEMDDLQLRLLQLQELLNKEKNEKQVIEEDKQHLLQELSNLQNDLRLWQGEISSLKEADVVKNKRKRAQRTLDRNIRALRAKVARERHQIQKELDRIALENGNRGFVTKDGELTYVPKQAVELDRIIIRPSTGR